MALKEFLKFCVLIFAMIVVIALVDSIKNNSKSKVKTIKEKCICAACPDCNKCPKIDPKIDVYKYERLFKECTQSAQFLRRSVDDCVRYAKIGATCKGSSCY